MIRAKNIIHPGEIRREEFLKPMGIRQNRLAMVMSSRRAVRECPGPVRRGFFDALR